jgi:tRNA(adenine34) deaminase
MQAQSRTNFDEKDAQYWMRRALKAARRAALRDEVPIGAAIVGANGELLAIAGNRTRTNNDPTAHAEIVALRRAAQRSGNYRLTDAIVYSTIEPCAMCAGALVQARVRRLVYGARDARFGAVESIFHICDSDALNHRIEIISGILEEECRALMQDFFRRKRESKTNKNSESRIQKID